MILEQKHFQWKKAELQEFRKAANIAQHNAID